ncbi:hypothetical protein KW521_05245 [Vibrio fluvialis]|nr:hypothetical protein [Vibrio fluvialis]
MPSLSKIETICQTHIKISNEPSLPAFRHHQRILEFGGHRESRFFISRYQDIISLLVRFGVEIPTSNYLIPTSSGENVPLMIFLMRSDIPELRNHKEAFVYLLDLERKRAQAVLNGRTTTASYLGSKFEQVYGQLQESYFTFNHVLPKRKDTQSRINGGKTSKYDRFNSTISTYIRSYTTSKKSDRMSEEALRATIEREILRVAPDFNFRRDPNDTESLNELSISTVKRWIKRERERESSSTHASLG